MGIQFCNDCGNLLDISSTETLQCELCGKTTKNEALSHKQTSTSEKFPSKLRDRLKTYTLDSNSKTGGSGPRIELDCSKCPSKEVIYAQVQTRSADEGSTLFYTCVRCGHRWQEDN